MTTTTKSVIVIVILAVLALVAMNAYRQGNADATANVDSVLPSGTDTSDAGLSEDAAAIDANLSGLVSDEEEVDQSIDGHVAP